MGDVNGGGFAGQYPTPILRPPTLSFRDSTCSSNLSSVCSSSKKHVVIQDPNLNKIHQFKRNSFERNSVERNTSGRTFNRNHNDSGYVREEERRIERSKGIIIRKVVR